MMKVRKPAYMQRSKAQTDDLEFDANLFLFIYFWNYCDCKIAILEILPKCFFFQEDPYPLAEILEKIYVRQLPFITENMAK